jgi:potassium-transporting ATPase KdpC subunit
MKSLVKQSIILSAILIIVFGFLYPLLIAGIGKLSPGGGAGVKIEKNGKVVGYALIGQSFTDDKYFQGRPSAVNYNAAGSGGSNKGTTNPEYLQTVKARIDTFLVHNPSVKKQDIPSELVTASGSGLDPDISPKGADVQIARISKVRNISEEKIKALVDKHIEKPLLGILGTEKINVLKLNIALDELTTR